METKRHIFPRFYFMSNSDILEVLGQSKRPENVQPHLKKCFDNINKIKVVKVGRIITYSIYWRLSLNINKDKGIWHKFSCVPMSLLHGFLLQILKIFTYKKEKSQIFVTSPIFCGWIIISIIINKDYLINKINWTVSVYCNNVKLYRKDWGKYMLLFMARHGCWNKGMLTAPAHCTCNINYTNWKQKYLQFCCLVLNYTT